MRGRGKAGIQPRGGRGTREQGGSGASLTLAEGNSSVFRGPSTAMAGRGGVVAGYARLWQRACAFGKPLARVAGKHKR